jgi:hypothetical protein
MKKNKLIKLLFIFCLPILIASCEEEIGEEQSPTGSGIDFETVSSSYMEIDGTGTVTIPFRNGSVPESAISITGTATEGVDYELLSVTEEGVQIRIIDDNEFEPDLETIRVVIKGTTGNNVHTITIYSNCEDTEGYTGLLFRGRYEVVQDDWEDFHPGDILTLEAIDITHFRIVEYPGTTFSHKGLVITLDDLVTGTATIESQNNGSYNASGSQTVTTTGYGTVNGCEIQLTQNIALACCGSFNDLVLVLKKVPHVE